jgi:hypothetical protein
MARRPPAEKSDAPKKAPVPRRAMTMYSSKGVQPNAPVNYESFKLIVVANTGQKKRLTEQKTYVDRRDIIVLTAQEIQTHGCFGYEVNAVDWRPGWAMECDRPEEVVKRVSMRLASGALL